MAMPTREARVLVVVPAYEERASVGDVVRGLCALSPAPDVVVVDDGSGDGTGAVAEAAGAVVLRLPFNLGVGGAMRTGYRYAAREGYDAVVQIDADGQHDVTAVPMLVQALQGANIVVGSRFGGAGSYAVRGPRRWAMRLLARAVSRAAGTRLTDVTSGMRAADRRAIALWSRSYPPEYLGDTVEALVVAARAGLSIAQLPVQMRPREFGEPSQSLAAASLYLARALLALAIATIRSRETVPDV